MEASPFKHGDLVRHYIGGPRMTVDKFCAVLRDRIECVWFDEKYRLCRDCIRASDLELISTEAIA